MNTTRPALDELAAIALRIGLLSFGGPAGQIALMHRILVDEKKWLGEKQFLHALNFCMLLPGPEAMQLATYSGWLVRGIGGGLVAGLLFILPGAFVLLALSAAYAVYGDLPIFAGLILGLKAAVLAIVVQALTRVGRRALKGNAGVALAVASFLALAVFHVPFPLVIACAAVAGLAMPGRFSSAEIAVPASAIAGRGAICRSCLAGQCCCGCCRLP
ncbi:MAG: chromate transporter [Nitratireductor sp.]